ncbi:putative transcriptional regulator, TetR family protein [Streptomyces bingchenggensis BCW-1]|uniref:Putative transcriptional regulator, TetR family protein n=2 Tax=Streptomyces TaxID=1883 RepID=D7CBG3_STRBB|nr:MULTISPECIES: hypothetical protein [Streptomyces]ADI12840.1 putative transcriptional regulator, TetR family protein [Streptomyces bingchenggensis BCW-1]
MKMIRLADTEPALRTAWLMACDQTEQQLRVIIGDRLGRPAGDPEVRLHAAATAAVVRVLDEQIGVAFLAGTGATWMLSRPHAEQADVVSGHRGGSPYTQGGCGRPFLQLFREPSVES